MDWHLMAWLLAAIAAVALMAAFRMGARWLSRAAVPGALVLFLALAVAICAQPGGFALDFGSLMLIFPLAAVELFAMGGVMLLSRDGTVGMGSAASLIIAALLAVLYTAAPAIAGASGIPVVTQAVGLLSFAGLWLSFSLALLALCGAAWRVRTRNMAPGRKHPYRFIVVHGAAISGTRPSQLLMSRLDCAFTLWERQGKKGTVIVSGGKGPDEQVTEAHVMASYLRDRGVPKKSIVEEDRSSTTRENIACAREIMDGISNGASYRALLVTSEFHAFRCAYLAQRAGLDADVAGAATKGDIWARSIIREFGAVTADFPWTYAVVAGAWVVGLLVL